MLRSESSIHYFPYVFTVGGPEATSRSAHTHEHARTREAFVEMRGGEATHSEAKRGNEMPAWGIPVPVCGIRAHRTFVNTLALYACISSLFSLALSGAVK